jgi:hypothetical protein
VLPPRQEGGTGTVAPANSAALKTDTGPAPATNSAAVPVVTLPKPPPPRLQAVVYNPRRPSALINGRTLFVGDHFGELQVVAISPSSATLVGQGKTNVLTIEQ